MWKRGCAFVSCLATSLVLNVIFVRLFRNPAFPFFPFLPGESWESWFRMPWGYFVSSTSLLVYLPVWIALCTPTFFCHRFRSAFIWCSCAVTLVLTFWAAFLFFYGTDIRPAG